MTTRLPRRRLLRPQAPGEDTRRQARRLERRAKLEAEQQALARWMKRLKRAFHAVERSQTRVARLEREIARLQPS
jgi:hypothetical protein